MDSRQLKFDFKRAAKLALLDRLVIPVDRLVTQNGSQKRGAALRIVSLLRVIDGAAGDNSSCWAGEATIAGRMKISPRHVRRVIRESEELGLLVTTHRNKRWNHQTDIREINWNLVWEWSGSPELADNKVELADNKVRVGGQHCPPTRSNDPIKRPSTKPATPNPTEQTNRAGGTCARNQNSKSNWDAASQFDLVVVALRSWEPEPINGADSAVAEAKARGVTASELLQILRVAREAICVQPNGTSVPAWGAGAIRNRIAKAWPGEDPVKLWPPPGDQYQKAVQTLQREHSAQTAARRATEQSARAASVQADQAARLTALELSHGHELDQLLSDPKFAELDRRIESSGDKMLIAMSRQFGASSRGLRGRLLKLLSQPEVVMA